MMNVKLSQLRFWRFHKSGWAHQDHSNDKPQVGELWSNYFSPFFPNLNRFKYIDEFFMVQVVTTLKEADQKTRIEKETIIENLTKQIDSLRKRGEQSSNEQTKMLEAENKKLVTANTLFEASNSRLTEEKKQLGVRLKDLESRHEETLEESEKLSQQIKSIVVEKEQLVTSKDEAIEVKSEEFTRAKEKLIKSNEKLKADVSDLYTENSRLKLQLKQSGQTADSLRAENKRISGLEQVLNL